jgi:hypothetical protein
VQKFLIMFASRSQIEAITPEKSSNSVVSLSECGKNYKCKTGRQLAVQFWKHYRIHKYCLL